jgi:hypothetical protein
MKSYFLTFTCLLGLLACQPTPKTSVQYEVDKKPVQLQNEQFISTITEQKQVNEYVRLFASDKKEDNQVFFHTLVTFHQKGEQPFAWIPHHKFGLEYREYHQDTTYHQIYKMHGHDHLPFWYFLQRFPHGSDFNKSLAYIISKLDRDAKTLETLFQRYESMIYQYFDKATYQRCCKFMVDELLKSYKYWQTHEYEKAFAKYEKDRLKPDNKGSIIFYFFRESKYKHPVEDTSIGKNFAEKNWYDNFWYRRYQEKNMEAVYAILLKIQAKYATH